MEKKTKKQQPKKQETQEQTNVVYIENNSNGMAIAGFVCSFFIPLLGFIFGGIGLSKSSNLPENKGRGFSIAALAISAATFVIALIVALSVSR